MQALLKKVQTIKDMFRSKECSMCKTVMQKDDAGSTCNECHAKYCLDCGDTLETCSCAMAQVREI